MKTAVCKCCPYHFDIPDRHTTMTPDHTPDRYITMTPDHTPDHLTTITTDHIPDHHTHIRRQGLGPTLANIHVTNDRFPVKEILSKLRPGWWNDQIPIICGQLAAQMERWSLLSHTQIRNAFLDLGFGGLPSSDLKREKGWWQRWWSLLHLFWHYLDWLS